MLCIPPHELENKIYFKNNDVFLRENVDLTKYEYDLFEEYRENLRKANQDRFS